MTNNLKRAIDTELSGLRVSQREREMILRNALEGKKVKKKLSAAFVLVMVLVLSAAAALAYSLSRQYFEDVAKLESEHGYYDSWTLDEKLNMLGLMKEYGVEMDTAEADTLLSGEGMTQAERENRVDALIVGKYGGDDHIDFITLESVLSGELGDKNDWSDEQKTWYSEMLIDNALMGGDDDVFQVPSSDIIQPEQAIEIARAEILRAWELSESDLSGHKVSWAYLTHSTDKNMEKLHYEIIFEPADGGSGQLYSCYVSNEGKVLSSADDPTMTSPAENRVYTEINSHYIDEEISRMYRQYANEHGITSAFGAWPLQDQMAVTDMLRPLVLEHMASDPQYNASFKRLATMAYGVPDDHSISQEKALEIAKQALIDQLGVDKALAQATVVRFLFYEVTQPQAPLWRFNLTTEAGRSNDEQVEWRVCINAYTGEVTRVKSRCFDSSSPDFKLDQVEFNQ